MKPPLPGYWRRPEWLTTPKERAAARAAIRAAEQKQLAELVALAQQLGDHVQYLSKAALELQGQLRTAEAAAADWQAIAGSMAAGNKDDT